MNHAIPDRGRPRDALLAALDAMTRQDLQHQDGKAFGYVYDPGQEADAVGREAYRRFMGKNGLDPTVYPSLRQLENEVVGMCIRHLRGDAEVRGTFSSGGTESIMLAVKAARDRARARRPGSWTPEMLVPVTAHAAFHKAAHYLGVALVAVPVDPVTLRCEVAAMRAAITPDTVLLVGSAAGYAHGVVDPIPELGQLALEHDLLLHVDGCIGGFVLPYFRRLGADVTPFDFTVPGVTSISMDLHKYAYAPKGASVVLYRTPSLRRSQFFACAEWTGYALVNATVQSSKSGGPLAAAWAVMNFLGDDGYLAMAERMLAATRTLVEGIRGTDGLTLLGRPEMGLLGVASDVVDVFELCDALTRRGWTVQPQLAFAGCPRSLHLLVMPGNAPQAEALLADLRAAVTELRARPEARSTSPLADVAGSLAGLDPAAVKDEAWDRLLAMAGVGAGGVPGERADINRILDALSPAWREAILTRVMDRLFS